MKAVVSQKIISSDHLPDVAVFKAVLNTSTAQPVNQQLGFQALIQLEEALVLYRDPFLQAFSFPYCVPFEAWVLLHRQGLHRLVSGTGNQR